MAVENQLTSVMRDLCKNSLDLHDFRDNSKLTRFLFLESYCILVLLVLTHAHTTFFCQEQDDLSRKASQNKGHTKAVFMEQIITRALSIIMSRIMISIIIERKI